MMNTDFTLPEMESLGPIGTALDEVLKKIGKFFKNDATKVRLWLITPNLLLGDMRPLDMILLGREKKLLNFIDTAISDNKPIGQLQIMNQGVMMGIDFGAEDSGVYCLYEREGDNIIFKRVLTESEYYELLNSNEMGS